MPRGRVQASIAMATTPTKFRRDLLTTPTFSRRCELWCPLPPPLDSPPPHPRAPNPGAAAVATATIPAPVDEEGRLGDLEGRFEDENDFKGLMKAYFKLFTLSFLKCIFFILHFSQVYASNQAPHSEA